MIKLLFITIIFSLTLSCAATPRKAYHSPYNEEIKSLLTAIKTSDKKQKLQTIKRLGEIGQYSEKVKRELMRQFTSKDDKIRALALAALQLVVKKEALDIYIEDMSHIDPAKRYRAINAFLYYDDALYEEKKIYLYLMKALDDPHLGVRMEAVRGIGVKREKRALEKLAPLLITEKRNQKKMVISALGQIGKPVIPFLLKKLIDPLWQESSEYVAQTLFTIEGPVADGIFSLFNKLSRQTKLIILSEMKRSIEKTEIGRSLSKDNSSLFYYLNEILKDEKDPYASIEILKLLMDSNKDPLVVYDIINPLFKLLNDIKTDENVQFFARRTLAALDSSVSFPAIKKQLLTVNKAGKSNLIQVLGLISMPELIPILSHIIFNENEFKAEALLALKKLHSPYTIKTFISVLKENNVEFNQLCIDGLVGIGHRAAPTVSELLEDNTVEVRRHAAKILKFIGTKKEVPALIHALMDDDDQVRKVSAFTIGKLNATEAVPDLIALMIMDQSMLQFNQAANALQMIGPPAVPDLLELLKVDDHRSKVYAAWVLANIGTEKAILPIKELASSITDSGIPILVKSFEPNSYALVKMDAITESLRIILSKTHR